MKQAKRSHFGVVLKRLNKLIRQTSKNSRLYPSVTDSLIAMGVTQEANDHFLSLIAQGKLPNGRNYIKPFKWKVNESS